MPDVYIGNAQGRIAIWFDEQGARDLASLYGRSDRAYSEITKAIAEAYPADQEDTERKEWRCAPGEHSWQRFPQISDGIVCAKCGADQEDTDE